MEKQRKVVAVSGVKNSGKTTLICRLVEIFSGMGIRTAVIKHDGHDFDADVPGTDTYRQFQAGACGTAVFSSEKCMIVKRQKHMTEEELMEYFPEADLILLEGFKASAYPKIELVRKGNSAKSVCGGAYLLAIATNLPPEELERDDQSIPLLDLDNPGAVAAFLLDYWRD
ncbi:MAG: molybdopterin-guanine dinucleotide biosynthesis protein B [Eubacteriales bacterium]|nr:molybdopterin-guanine dinucleotide biosynthesis protein B [Eubacteriales bacterium]